MLRRRRQLARHCGETVVRLAWFGIMALGWRAVAVAERNLCRCYAATLPNLPGQSRLKRRPKPASTSRLPPFLCNVWMCAQRVLVGRLSPPHFQCGDTGAHQPHRIYNNAARETGDRLEPVVGGSPIDSRANETRGSVFASINRSTYQIEVHLRNPVRNRVSLSDDNRATARITINENAPTIPCSSSYDLANTSGSFLDGVRTYTYNR